jgi:hypothetical protein
LSRFQPVYRRTLRRPLSAQARRTLEQMLRAIAPALPLLERGGEVHTAVRDGGTAQTTARFAATVRDDVMKVLAAPVIEEELFDAQPAPAAEPTASEHLRHHRKARQ